MAADGRLDSWKEIANYLRRDVTTAQRWEKREGMPVHRHVHDKLGSVYAYRPELDAWAHGRNLRPAVEPVDTPFVPDRPAVDAASPHTWRPRTRTAVSITAAGLLALALGAAWWLVEKTDYFWRNPLDNARFQQVTDFGGTEQAAAVSADGKLVAFLSDRDGQMDVWLTQLGAGQFYNLTHGRFRGLGNPSLRMLGFSPDTSFVTFWARGVDGSNSNEISVWAVPTLGGQARPYLEGVAEFAWSGDGSRLVYHTPGPGDPTYIKDAGQTSAGRQIFAAAAGLHAHFPLWSRNATSIYFVQGMPPDAMDVWRVSLAGGGAERLTYHNSRVSHPVLLNDRTLMYLAGDKDGSGPWLYSMDVEKRLPHRVTGALDRYTSLAASADGRRLVATLANPKGTLWRLPVADTAVDAPKATPISLTTGRGFSPRIGSGYLLYVSSKAESDGIWKLSGGAATELWTAPGARVVGGPEISPDGTHVAFSVDQRGRTSLYVMNANGTDAKALTESLRLQGSPAWMPDGRSLTVGANVDGTPHLFRVSLDGSSVSFVQDYAVDPVWAPNAAFLLYSGADVGTTFPVKAVTAAGVPYAIPSLMLTRGARRLRFLGGRRALVMLRGEIQHKNLWLVDLDTGVERQLTNLASDFDIRDFDVSPDGREIVLERLEERSDVVLIDLALK
jgi:Tol biopolymer transport system component